MLTGRTSRDVPGKVTDEILRMEESSLEAVFENPDTVGALAEGFLAGALGEQAVLLAGVALAALLLCRCRPFRGRAGRRVFCQGGGEGDRDQGKAEPKAKRTKQLHG